MKELHGHFLRGGFLPSGPEQSIKKEVGNFLSLPKAIPLAFCFDKLFILFFILEAWWISNFQVFFRVPFLMSFLESKHLSSLLYLLPPRTFSIMPLIFLVELQLDQVITISVAVFWNHDFAQLNYFFQMVNVIPIVQWAEENTDPSI